MQIKGQTGKALKLWKNIASVRTVDLGTVTGEVRDENVRGPPHFLGPVQEIRTCEGQIFEQLVT